MLFGTPLDESKDHRFLELLKQFPIHINNLLPMDIFAPLQYLPNFRKKITDAKVHTTELMSLIDEKIKVSRKTQNDISFVNTVLEREGENADMEQLRYTVRDFLFAGSETVSTTIHWMVILIANHQEVQKRVQTEIDSVVERERLPVYEELSKLKYVEAVLLEMMRYKTVAPMALSHLTTRDTEVSGYFIPKNTIVSIFLAGL